MGILATAAAVAASLAGGDPAALPDPNAPLPRGPVTLARRLRTTEAALGPAVRRWTREGEPSRGAPPEDVTLLALDQQRALRLLAREPDLVRRVLRRQPPSRRRAARDIVTGMRALRRLPPGSRTRDLRVGAPLPAGRLLAFLRKAERRFGVPWHLLAAVNLVETAFGRLTNTSVAGAQGPMQFIPSTWRAYGMGGDVRDPHDAILGAANLLRASGAPRRVRRALYAYNPASEYVEAVSRYSRVMARRPSAFYELYSWQVFFRTDRGDRRLTGPGLSR